MLKHHNYKGYNDYLTWKETLYVDMWQRFLSPGLRAEVYGRVVEYHDEEDMTFYEREFLYEGRYIDETDLDDILRRSVRTPAVRIASSADLSVNDLPAA